jgi:superfamily II DNA or RNA helicase
LLAQEVSSASTPVAPLPCLRLRLERMLVERGEPPEHVLVEEDLPVVEVGFRYPPGSCERDPSAEARTRRVLESFGCVEVGCLEGVEPEPGSKADYLVRPDGDVHAYCSFGSHVLPQLRALGWRIEVADGYPYRVLDGDHRFYADVTSEGDDADWFSLELGIEVGEERVNLVPALLDLLATCSDLRSLDRLCNRSPYIALPVGDGRYATIPSPKIRRLLAVLRELYQGGGVAPASAAETRAGDRRSGLRLPRVGAIRLPELDSILAPADAELSWSGDAALVRTERLVMSLPSTPVEPGTLPTTLRATLRPYQLAGLGWLQALGARGLGGVLADDMGLGKTLQTIAHLTVEQAARRLVRPALIVAPTTLVENWRRELGRFAPRLSTLVLVGPNRHAHCSRIPCADVVLTSYPLVLRDQSDLARFEYHLLVLDEAQVIKNARSRIHAAVSSLRARGRLCLSGTPIENDLGELWSLFDFLMPGHLGTAEQFQRWFRGPIELGDQPALDLLRRRVRPLLLRRMKEQVSRELPPKTVLVRPVELSDEQRELYEHIRVAAHAEVRRAIRQKGLLGSTVTVLDALLKLRQVCCDPRLVAVDAARRVGRSAKYEALLELVGRQVGEGRRILVFSQFARMLALIAEGLIARRIRYVVLTGSSTNRHQLVDEFQARRAEVFLVSLKAGGTGLNLTAADTVIHYDPWWNPAAQAQATDRAHRVGQTQPVFVYQLIVAGSVEERMLRLQAKKQALAESVVGGPSSLVARLGEAEVEDLLAPLDD